MILVTHALAGAALTHTYRSLLVAFFVSFTSHYFLDMIPHWHYHAPRVKYLSRHVYRITRDDLDVQFRGEIVKIAIDFLLGVSVSLLLFGGSRFLVIVAACGAVLPDFLSGLAKFFPLPPLRWHEQFHRWIHTDVDLDAKAVLGVGTQAILAVFFAVFF